MWKANGWTLFPYSKFSDQLAKLKARVAKARAADPAGYGATHEAKLLAAIMKLINETIPADPAAKQFRQGDTLGASRKHWFRAKFGNGRYRLFFQFNSTAKIIIYAWVNDEQTLRAYGARTDAYAVFQKMLKAGDPPDSWEELAKAVVVEPEKKPKPARAGQEAKGKAPLTVDGGVGPTTSAPTR